MLHSRTLVKQISRQQLCKKQPRYITSPNAEKSYIARRKTPPSPTSPILVITEDHNSQADEAAEQQSNKVPNEPLPLDVTWQKMCKRNPVETRLC